MCYQPVTQNCYSIPCNFVEKQKKIEQKAKEVAACGAGHVFSIIALGKK